MSAWVDCLIFVGCVGSLWLSTGFFVSRLEDLTYKWGVSMLSVSSIVLAVLTSIPELLVSIQAVLNGSTELAMGNILGSVVANSALVLGVCGLIKPVVVHARVFRIDLPLSIGLLFFLSVVSYWAIIPTWFVGLVLLSVYLGYLFLHLSDGEPSSTKSEKINGFLLWLGLMLSAVVLFFSCYGMVVSAEALANYWGLSQKWIGLTVLAIGTSLPELSASIEGHRRGHDDLVLGNVLGSNCFLIFGVLGAVCLIAPNLVLGSFIHDFTLLIGVLIILAGCLLYFDKGYRLNRIESCFLLVVYFCYILLAW